MNSALPDSNVQTQGHVALYAQDRRWLQAVDRNLEAAGHSCQAASTSAEVRELLVRQRFDVLVVKIRSEAAAGDLAQALEGVTQPRHTIVLGSVSALSLNKPKRRFGTFRYIPGSLPAADIRQLVESSIGAGAWEEEATDNGDCTDVEVDLHEVVDRAAAAVASQANRKRQHFNSVVYGPTSHVVANRVKLRRTLTSLLRLMVLLAPTGATVSVDAQGGTADVTFRVQASNGAKANGSGDQLTEELRDETDAVDKVSATVREQGGMLWVELAGPSAFGICMTLPLTKAVAEPASA